MPALTVAEIAALCGGSVSGSESHVITGANTLEDAGQSELAFAQGKAVKGVPRSMAGCLLVPAEFESADRIVIRVPDPRAAFARALAALYPKPRLQPGVHPTAVIAATARVADDCFVGAYVSIGENTVIGKGCDIAAGCRIGSDVVVGAETVLQPNVTIYERVRIGARVLLHAGCVIGADGFGFAFAGDHYERFPQVGAVHIGDDVEVGANSCVDRAALGVTRIGSGTKIDNQVHIGHNCSIGKHVVIAAQVGLSGGVTIGDYAVIGGQAGFGEKAVVDPKAVIGGAAGVLPKQRIHAGEPVWGVPARPLKQHLRGLAQVARLPELRDDLKEVKKRLDRFESHRQ